MTRIPLREAVGRLQAAYGPPKLPRATDPWHWIVRENVVYLADDGRRQEAFATLKKQVGLRPEQILSAPGDTLLEIASHGIMPESRVEKLRRCAEIALEQFAGDLRPVLDWPVAKAKKALQKFPSIGEPGAEKILLFCRRLPALALESNGLRVLVRLGFGAEHKNYATMYRLVQKDAAEELPADCDRLIAAHLLLRTHGQETCHRSQPACDKCPLAAECPSATL